MVRIGLLLTLLSILSAQISIAEHVKPLKLLVDDVLPYESEKAVGEIKVSLPSLPYLAITHSINGTLIKPADNERGWEYELATAHKKISDKIYEFKLRKGVRFQDGSAFDAYSVIENLRYFKLKPFTYSKMHQVFFDVKKIDQYTVRIFLNQPYGTLINDLMQLPFYTGKYLKKFGWNGKSTAANLAEPGPYGLGPYVLKKGYVEGDRHTPIVELEANPYYWDQRYPKVKKITVFTELDPEQARNEVLYSEGKLDLTYIAPEHKIETILSPFAKLITSKSNDGIAIHFNMINPTNKNIINKEIRRALNEALQQERLLFYAMDREGVLSPTLASPEFPGISKAIKNLLPYSQVNDSYLKDKEQELKGRLDGQEFIVITQSRFLPLWRSIETQLKKVGVKLLLNVKKSETEVFEQLLSTKEQKNTIKWDMLAWGDDDWFYNHPWSAFFVYRTTDKWSTLLPDPIMNDFIEQMFKLNSNSDEFVEIANKIMLRAYEQAYMLLVPTPNKVMAVNKEIIFKPYKSACVPLWKIGIGKNHRSVRRGAYPVDRKKPWAKIKY